MRVSWARFCVRIYEIKASRPDFLRDVASGKFQAYFPACNELWFATAPGLLKAHEVPESCGLVEVRPPGDRADGLPSLRSVKRPTPRDSWPPVKMLCGLLMSHDTRVDRRSGFPMPSRREDQGISSRGLSEAARADYERRISHSARVEGRNAACAVAQARAMVKRAAWAKDAADFGRLVAQDLGVRPGADPWPEAAKTAWDKARAGTLSEEMRVALRALWRASGGVEVEG